MRLVRFGVVVALAGAVAAQTSSSTIDIQAADRPPASVAGAPAPALPLSVADDLHPNQYALDADGVPLAPLALTFVGTLEPTPAATDAPQLPTPVFELISTSDLPRPGTAQAVLAAAYRKAVAAAPDDCNLREAHLAAIGQVESASLGGRTVTSDHRVSPPIYGPVLNGGPFAVIRDTDQGRYDGVLDYDRAVGPMQFIPGTWERAGRDGDGDGQRDPQNVYDATLAAAYYLCGDGRDLSDVGDLRAAILAYNQSVSYYFTVLGWLSYFDEYGLAALGYTASVIASGGRANEFVDRPAVAAARTPIPSAPVVRPPVSAAPPVASTTPSGSSSTAPSGTTTTTPSGTSTTPSGTSTTPSGTSTTPSGTSTTTTTPPPSETTTTTPPPSETTTTTPPPSETTTSTPSDTTTSTPSETTTSAPSDTTTTSTASATGTSDPPPPHPETAR